jgi:hypothetical protein
MRIEDDEISALKIGEVIYECRSGVNIEVRITSEPVQVPGGYDGRKQWQWTAENTQNAEPIAYLITEGLSHYGPRLYRQPQYVRVMEGGLLSFPRLGGEDLVLP